MDWSEFASWVIPNPEACRAQAAKLREAHPDMSPEELARTAVRTAKKWAAAAGGAAGPFTNPLTMLPATMVEAPVVLRIEGKLAGVVAALLDPTSLDDYEMFSADVLSIVFPGAVSQTLRGLGVRAGQVLTKETIRKYISKDVLKAVVKFVSKYLGIKLTQKTIITKTVPLVGMVIGSTWNWVEVQAVGNRALHYYSQPAPDGK